MIDLDISKRNNSNEIEITRSESIADDKHQTNQKENQLVEKKEAECKHCGVKEQRSRVTTDCD